MDLLYYHIRKNADIILPGVNCSVGAAVQPITKLHMQAAIDNGGDAIALDPARGNFVSKLPHITNRIRPIHVAPLPH